jgi:regulator of replication initiation timing
MEFVNDTYCDEKGIVKMDKYIMDNDGHLTRNPNYEELKVRNHNLGISVSNLLEENDCLKEENTKLREENKQLKVEKDKWFNAFHKQIMKPF